MLQFVFNFYRIILNTTNMSTFIESLDLWASAKFIGRQCSTVNKNYLLCRENFINDNPTVCTQEGDLVHACAANV